MINYWCDAPVATPRPSTTAILIFTIVCIKIKPEENCIQCDCWSCLRLYLTWPVEFSCVFPFIVRWTLQLWQSAACATCVHCIRLTLILALFCLNNEPVAVHTLPIVRLLGNSLTHSCSSMRPNKSRISWLFSHVLWNARAVSQGAWPFIVCFGSIFEFTWSLLEKS